MVSDKVDFLAGNCMGAMPRYYELIMFGTRTAKDERSGLLTRIAATESHSLCVEKKS
jgi:hypothetical protein